MIVKVKLHDTLSNIINPNLRHSNTNEVILLPGTTVKEMILRLGIEEELIALIIVNKRQSDLDQVLQSGDLVELFSPLAGG